MLTRNPEPLPNEDMMPAEGVVEELPTEELPEVEEEIPTETPETETQAAKQDEPTETETQAAKQDEPTENVESQDKS